jgi:hypothetical protein
LVRVDRIKAEPLSTLHFFSDNSRATGIQHGFNGINSIDKIISTAARTAKGRYKMSSAKK